MHARYYLYIGIASFFAFSIGLNIGLLGFHNFHFEQNASKIKVDNSVPSQQGYGNVIRPHKHRADVLIRRSSSGVPGDIIAASEVAVHRDTSTLEVPMMKPGQQSVYKEDTSVVVATDYLPPSESNKGQHSLAVTPNTQVAVPVSKQQEVTVTKPYAAMGDGPIATFLRQGGEIPIVLITCNRVELLEQTIQNLLKVHHITKDIIVVQDGTLKSIADTAKSHGLEIVQNKEDNRRLRGSDGASRIATHYKFALTTVFNLRPHAPAAIIIEDDLLFSPDFYDYFLHTAAVMEQDKTVFAVSAWNDNGFKGRVADPFALRRTEFFPGLGWLLSRALYKNELESKWPKNHWDHWLRAPETHKGREIVYPQVPRTYHNGIKGTFMNMDTHNQYFRDIAYNQDPSVDWSQAPTSSSTSSTAVAVYDSVTLTNYEARIQQLLQTCHHVTDVQDFIQHRAAVYCIWIKEDPDPSYGTPPFQPIAKVFGIWHEHKRGVHKGMHEFYWSPKGSDVKDQSYFLVLNTMSGQRSYEAYKPANVPLLTPKHFKALLPHLRGGH